jgi:hypothetical protein
MTDTNDESGNDTEETENSTGQTPTGPRANGTDAGHGDGTDVMYCPECDQVPALVPVSKSRVWSCQCVAYDPIGANDSPSEWEWVPIGSLVDDRTRENQQGTHERGTRA